MLAKRWTRWRGSCARWLLVGAICPLAAAQAQPISDRPPATQPSSASQPSQPARSFLPASLPATEAGGQSPVETDGDQPTGSRWSVLARSVEDRAIEYRQFGQADRQVLVVGPLEGDNTAGVRLIELLAEHLERFPRRLDNVAVTLVRDPNPDGRFRRAAGNARGVMIDQNFATRAWRKAPVGGRWLSGRTPNSEPETKALIELLADVRPDRVIVIGASRRSPELAFLGPAETVGRRMQREARLPLGHLDPNIEFGSLAAFTGEHGVSTVVLRVPEGMAESAAWDTYKRALLAGMAFEPADGDGHDAPAQVAAKPSQPAATSGAQLARIAHSPPENRDSLRSGTRENSDPNARPRPDFSRSQLRAGAQSGLASLLAKKPADPPAGTAPRREEAAKTPAARRAARVLSAAELRLGGTVVPVPPVRRERDLGQPSELNRRVGAPNPTGRAAEIGPGRSMIGSAGTVETRPNAAPFKPHGPSPPTPLPGVPGRGERTNAVGGSAWRGVAPRPLTSNRSFTNRQPSAPHAATITVPSTGADGDLKRASGRDNSDMDNTVRRLPPVDPNQRVAEPASPEPIPFYPDTGY